MGRDEIKLTYISVDVETSGLVLSGGYTLLSVGAVDCFNLNNTFHEVMADTEDDKVHWDRSTKEWWDTQTEAKQRLAAQKKLQYPEGAGSYWQVNIDAANRFVHWLEHLEKPLMFVAWPASFDYPWIQQWFYENELDNPFSYRTIDVKSYACGKLGIDFNADREAFPDWLYEEPEFPHDALSDAITQAKQFRKLMEY